MTYISSNLSIEPVEMANVNYGTSLQNEPFNTYAETFDETSKGVGIYGNEGSFGSGPVGGRHILQCILFFCKRFIKHSAQLYPFLNIRVFKMIYQKVGKRLIWDPENSIITI